MTEFEAKDSSNVGWARYDPDLQTLEIDFKDKNGNRASTYEYKYFPVTAWEAFQAAPSKGKHFASDIRPRYKGVKLSKPLVQPTEEKKRTDLGARRE